VIKSGNVPNQEEVDALKQIIGIKLKGEKEITIPANFYDSLKYKLDIVVTDEQIDLASKFSLLQVLIQMLGSNPTILQDPTTKKYFMQLLEMGGISPATFESVESNEETLTTPAQMGGSVARTSTPNTQPTRMTASQTI
jgi:hypothetical protein